MSRTYVGLAAVLGFVLFACADIVGLEEPLDGNDSKSATTPRKTRSSSEPETGALGGEETKNTDSQAGGLEVTPALDFGTVGCGEQRVEKLMVANKENIAREYKIEMPDGSPFSTDTPLQGVLPAHAAIPITIVSRPTTAGELKANIVVTAGSSFVTVPAGVIGAGGALEWSAMSAKIPDAPLNGESTVTVKLRNTGVRGAMVTGWEGTTRDFAIAPSSFEIPANAEKEVTLTLTRGANVTNELRAQLRPVVQGSCAGAPEISVTGRRVNTNVTVSGVDWGKQPCGLTPEGTRAVEVRNYTNQSVEWLVPNRPSRFSLVGEQTGSAPPSPDGGIHPGVGRIEIKAPSLGATLEPVTEELTVMVNAAPIPNGQNDLEQKVLLQVSPRGAIIAFDKIALTFQAAKGTTAPSQSITLRNTGNEPAALSWVFLRTDGGPAWLGNPQSTTTNAGSATRITIGYRPSTDPPNRATLTPSRRMSSTIGGTICNPEVLTALTLQGI